MSSPLSRRFSGGKGSFLLSLELYCLRVATQLSSSSFSAICTYIAGSQTSSYSPVKSRGLPSLSLSSQGSGIENIEVEFKTAAKKYQIEHTIPIKAQQTHGNNYLWLFFHIPLTPHAALFGKLEEDRSVEVKSLLSPWSVWTIRAWS